LTHLANLRNARYCEIYLINPAPALTSIYNTTGLDNCPTQQWNALNPTGLAKQYYVAAAYLNGQRFWVLDQTVIANVKGTASFGGIEARLWASSTVPLPSGPGAPFPSYTDQAVSRISQSFYMAGSFIYELIDPRGNTYVMQSYSHIVDKSLTVDDLLSLGSQLQLPSGWQYQVQVLTGNFANDSVNGVAHVIQDNLQNTYQLSTGVPSISHRL
jgi:hypothetical protein